MRQAPDHHVTSHALAPTASTPPTLTNNAARQHCTVWPHALARHLQAQVIQARERAQVRAIKSSIGHVEVFQMDGVGISIIERPRPLPGHDTPNPTQHPYTLKCEEPTNRGISTIRFQHTKYNHGNYARRYWGTSPIGSRRTKPPISTPDAGVTGAGWTGGNGRASRRGAERSEIAKSRGRTGLATPETTRRPQQRDGRNNAGAAAPVTGRDTRYGALHPLRGATPDQKGCIAYGSGAAHPITRTNAESARRSPTRTRPRELAPGPQHTAISQRSTWRRRGRRRR